MDLLAPMQKRLDELVQEFGILAGYDKFEIEVERILTALMIDRMEYYIMTELRKN